jgi:transcriptional regulator with XRE-family HTH domain
MRADALDLEDPEIQDDMKVWDEWGERPDLGRLLSTLRLRRNISQGALARTAGVDHSYISRLESGERSAPPLRTLAKLADALNLSPEERIALIEAGGFLIGADH